MLFTTNNSGDILLFAVLFMMTVVEAAAVDNGRQDDNVDEDLLVTNLTRAAEAVNRLENYLWDLEDRLECATRTLDGLSSARSMPQKENPRDCGDIYKLGKSGGVHTIWPSGPDTSFDVVCNFDAEGAWTLIQRRVNGDTDFQRSWASCKNGFGTLAYFSNFWLGLEKVHLMTSQRQYTLRIEITDWDGEMRYADYSLFAVDDEASNYRLSIHGYIGTAGDAFSPYHDGASFSTRDRDNDRSFYEHCALTHQGPWWYDSCDDANLNGRYRSDISYVSGEIDVGIEWSSWKDRHPFKESCMSIKPTFDDDF